ncbi:Nucleotidyltransferase domain-containing protein [Anaerovirgula multivorans]|uniref:Nucleotidyltransferase domain-containing protein n=1 Tax=Anaerovirgula multivorans TaxID=312168 RepID=A0A239LEC4_9FIRM|nr:nucleotidyltransferase domain-containing protein [Anaerovirgula multivorans]SNT27989.1 Nucleotidyltransferase domain-containing protein [Anaerovirgula multivorans]
MNFFIDDWIDKLVSKIKNEYGDRVAFIGLQGSYKRKEASDSSDIDIVVILNQLTMQDLKKYRAIISQMPYKEKACGFISGQSEILSWEKSDLFQFYYDTQPIYGSIDHLLLLIDKDDVKRAIKIGACNLYHACCHNFLYEKSSEMLSALYKSAFFILQAKYFDETNQYISSKTDLVKHLDGIDKEILNICIDRKKLTAMNEDDLALYYDKIICWSSKLLQSY